MSGPKYYDFNLGSPERAAGVLAQLASFGVGVEVKVVNNELKFVVSSDAWYDGMTYDKIAEKIEKAKIRYDENERLKRILEEKKQKARTAARNAKIKIESDYNVEKAKIAEARAKITRLKSQACFSIETPFGNYNLSKMNEKVIKAEQKLASDIAALERSREETLSAIKAAESKIYECSSITSLDGILRNLTDAGVTKNEISGVVSELEVEMNDKTAKLKAFATASKGIFAKLENAGLTGYVDRLKAEISKIDVFAEDSINKISVFLKEIEAEVELLKAREQSAERNAEIEKDVQEKINALDELSKSLKPIIESTTSASVTSADYSAKSAEIIKALDDIFSHINSLDFVNGETKGKVDKIFKEVTALKHSVMSQTTVERLRNNLTVLRELESECIKIDETYSRFKTEYDEYEKLYVTLQGFLSSDGVKLSKKDEENALPSPTEVILSYDDPEEQIKVLKQRNEKLRELVGECTKESMSAAIGAAAEKDGRGKRFKKVKKKGGSIGLTFVREECKGAIFDADCSAEGKIEIYPRGVVLYNGKKTISAKELKRVHSSCGWAGELQSAFSALGMSEAGSYEEMPEEVLLSMYDEKNFYHIETFDESLRFLRLSGYSEEEINELLDIADSDEIKTKKADENEISFARAVKPQ